MELIVDLQHAAVDLAAPGDTTRFSVRVAGPAGASPEAATDVHRLGEVLAATGVGRLVGTGDAFVLPDAVRSRAAGQVGEGWEEQFGAMCEYAATKGWVDEADGAVQAHVEWPGPGR